MIIGVGEGTSNEESCEVISFELAVRTNGVEDAGIDVTTFGADGVTNDEDDAISLELDFRTSVDVDALFEDVFIGVDDGSMNKEGDGVITKGDVISAEFKVEICAVDAGISDVAANVVIFTDGIISFELDAWIKGVEDTFNCDVIIAIDATANEEGWRLILTDDVTVFEVLAIGDDSKVNVPEVNKMNT